MRIQTTSRGGFDRMRIKSMRIHVNATDPDRMHIRCASRCPCESALKIDESGPGESADTMVSGSFVA